MIYGIGTDIAEVKRFMRWIHTPAMIERFFNKAETLPAGFTEAAACQHYAARFAAKEAFAKALGTGITGFELKDVYIVKTAEGRPVIALEHSAAVMLHRRCGLCRLHVSLSHEKDYATACVIIECIEGFSGTEEKLYDA